MPVRTDFANPFSVAQTKLIVIAFRHMKGTPDIDFEAVAQEYGYGSAQIARSKFCAARALCKSSSTGEAGAISGSNTSTPIKRKAVEAGTPGSKRGRKPGKAKGKADENFLADLEGLGGGSENFKERVDAYDGKGDAEIKDDPDREVFEKSVQWM